MSLQSGSRLSLFVLSGLLSVGIAQNGMAADQELLDILLANGAITEAQHAQLLEKETLEVEDVSSIRMSSDGLEVIGANGDFEFNLGGRLHLDAFSHEHQTGLPEQPSSGSAVRRSRLEIDGLFSKVWGYAAEVDFANDEVEVKDAKIGYVGGNNWTLYAGNQKQPYSLALEMSSNDIPFVERAVDNALVSEYFDRSTGIRLDIHGDKWFFAGGLFGDAIKAGGPGDEGYGAMGRFIYAPIQHDKHVLHLGMRAGFRKTDDRRSARVSDKTTEFSGFSIVDTGLMTGVEEVRMAGPEFVWAAGPFTLFGEFNQAKVVRDVEADLDFDSFHVAATWSLSGESRAMVYDMSSGEFKGFRPAKAFDPASGTWGGLELVTRYAETDLNDGLFTGGRVEQLNTGLNWYPAYNVRFMFDWMHVLGTDESNLVRSIVPDMDVFTLRAQYHY